MAPHKKSQMPVSGHAPKGDFEKTYSAKMLSDVEECAEPSSPTLPGSMGDIYKIRRGRAIKELQGLIQQIRMHEVDISEVAESLAQFAEKQNIILQTAGDDAFLAKWGNVPECLSRELTKLMVRIKALSHILSLNADRSHVEIVPVMLERVRLDIIGLKVVRFLDTKKTGREICATNAGQEALNELEESLFERYPIARQCFDAIEPAEVNESEDLQCFDAIEPAEVNESEDLQCLCWKCILRMISHCPFGPFVSHH